jgi:hypothetical protein
MAKRRQALARKAPVGPTREEVEAGRVHRIYQAILEGASEHDVLGEIAAAWPDVDVRPLVVRAMERVARAGEADPALVRGWCIEASRELYRRMLEGGDLQGALRAVKQLAELAGA